MTLEVGLDAFASAHAGGAIVIDVREPDESGRGHVPGARLIPVGTLPDHAAGMPSGEPVYLICATGNRSFTAARFLAGRGVDARSVAGGTRDWAARGWPVHHGSQGDLR